MSDLETLAREWEDKVLDPPDKYGQWHRDGARRLLEDFGRALLRSRDEQRDKAWRDRGHSDGKGGCFYTRTNHEERERALRIVEEELAGLPRPADRTARAEAKAYALNKVLRRLEEVAGEGR